MPYFDSRRKRAAALVIALGIGVAVALSPYASGLIGAAVLYVVFAPLNDFLRRHMNPVVSAALVTATAVVVIMIPGASAVTLIVTQAQQMAGELIRSPLLQRLGEMEVAGFRVGPQIQRASENLFDWLGTNAFALIGTATRLALNLAIAFFALYFILHRPNEIWEAARPYIPFSAQHTERLRQRFRDVTYSTLIGTMLIAVVQGGMTGAAFWVVGLSDPLFWGLVTAILSILPIVGSGMIWGPGALALGLDGRLGAAIGLFLWGMVIVGSADNVIRPIVYRKWARIHPLVTLVGAIAGIKYFGVLGILVGPLALSYFFELIRMYREEFLGLEPDSGTAEMEDGNKSGP